MLILVSNVGSTSLKYRLYRFPEEDLLAHGRVERIGQPQGAATWSHGPSQRGQTQGAFPTHREAIAFVLQQMQADGVCALDEIACVGFKTVIAKGITGCEWADARVLKAMDDYVFLAPAHNPPYINAIRQFEELLPHAPRVALFEPAFHRTVPDYARTYPIPRAWRERHQIQRYGFHGASHRYVSERVPQLVGKPRAPLNVISCHLGGSSSICAIQQGRSVDCSLGFTPQTGVFHGTRIGEFDPFAVLYLMREEGYSIDDMVAQLTQESGLRGLSEVSEDMRDIEAAMEAGNDNARLAFDAFAYQVKKYIGAYHAILGGIDAIAFAGGIGERGARIRKAICDGLQHLGIGLDDDKNIEGNGEEHCISQSESPVAVWIVPTNEELIVGRAAYEKMQSA
mgnify:CR=1 FL=1